MTYNILLIATYDSFLKSGINIAEKIKNGKITLSLSQTRANQLSPRQLKEAKALAYPMINLRQLEYSDYANYDILILSAGNGTCRKIIKELLSHLPAHQIPLIISIFPGVIFGQVDSLLSRINSHIMLVNSQYDYAVAQQIATIYGYPVKIIPYGLINISTKLKQQLQQRPSPPNMLVFIDQVKAPAIFAEKEYIFKQLLKLAQANPDKQVVIKLRILAHEKTVHQSPLPYERLFKQYKKQIPANFYSSIEPMECLYPKMALCISLYSTVILEAIYYGIPAVVINDLGLREEFGSHYFIHSNIIASFADIQQGKIAPIDPHWYKTHIEFSPQRTEQLNVAIQQLMAERSEMGKAYDNQTRSTQTPAPPPLLFGGGFRYRASTNILSKKLKKLLRNPRGFVADMKIVKFFKNLT